MNKNQTLILITAIILCAALAGCVSQDVEPLSNGYREVTYTWNSISEPSAHRISLQYLDSKGKQTIIWPSLYGVKEVIEGDVAVFVGNTADDHPSADEPRATRPRLFAVKATGPPLDITDEVLWRWSQQTGGDFQNVLKTSSIVFSQKNGNMVELHFATWPPSLPDILVQLDWNQVFDIMREVKEKGVVRKDRVWGASYIEKEFKPETTDK